MLSFVELKFQGLTDHPDSMPEFSGIPIRGALGHLLKQIVCQSPHGECSICLLKSACPYPAVFEGLPPANRTFMTKYPQIPQPFVLAVDEPALPGSQSNFCFSVRLFGSAIRYWPYVCHTFFKAGEAGLGRNRTVIKWLQVGGAAEGKSVWSADSAEWSEPEVRTAGSSNVICPNGQADVQRLRWKFITPLNMPSVDLKRRPEELGLQLYLGGKRRWDTLQHFYGAPTDALAIQPSDRRFDAEEFRTLHSEFRPWAATRFSGRQQRRMTVQGLTGEAVIEGPWGQTGVWLNAIPVIHVGKKTSFGFGRVEWEMIS
ncbi:MAG: CRISPR system precrRNA processing endoribonuclease RAMP protein Cas6 [Planctomycetaceae bacterium]|nr:CRISPR system precrRNA processing endoribonuclease RAMP protein Cas6 [Planctomycetaceae bacterium]